MLTQIRSYLKQLLILKRTQKNKYCSFASLQTQEHLLQRHKLEQFLVINIYVHCNDLHHRATELGI